MKATNTAAPETVIHITAMNGHDLTGEGALVPDGHIRIFRDMADEYRAAGYVVKEMPLVCGGNQVVGVVVSFTETERRRLERIEEERQHARVSRVHKMRRIGRRQGEHGAAT